MAAYLPTATVLTIEVIPPNLRQDMLVYIFF